MFVKSFMEVEVTYRKSVGDTVLKPMTVTFVDENIVSAEELKACYGDRIAIIPSDMEETIVKEVANIQVLDNKQDNNEKVDKEQVQDVISKEEDIPTEYVKDMVDFLDDLKNDKIPLKGATVNKEQVQNVIDFLEGKTDDLPEGTEIISQEEADKLKKEAVKEDNVNNLEASNSGTQEVTLTVDSIKKDKEEADKGEISVTNIQKNTVNKESKPKGRGKKNK